MGAKERVAFMEGMVEPIWDGLEKHGLRVRRFPGLRPGGEGLMEIDIRQGVLRSSFLLWLHSGHASDGRTVELTAAIWLTQLEGLKPKPVLPGIVTGSAPVSGLVLDFFREYPQYCAPIFYFATPQTFVERSVDFARSIP
jgi:hypothetical protein